MGLLQLLLLGTREATASFLPPPGRQERLSVWPVFKTPPKGHTEPPLPLKELVPRAHEGGGHGSGQGGGNDTARHEENQRTE